MHSERNEFICSLNTLDKVSRFCSIATNTQGEVVIDAGSHMIDAKSILGIFTMDLSRTLTVRIYTDNTDICAAFQQKIEEFLVPD